MWWGGLRIWHCHCRNMSGVSIPGQGISTCCERSQKKKKKREPTAKSEVSGATREAPGADYWACLRAEVQQLTPPHQCPRAQATARSRGPPLGDCQLPKASSRACFPNCWTASGAEAVLSKYLLSDKQMNEHRLLGSPEPLLGFLVQDLYYLFQLSLKL